MVSKGFPNVVTKGQQYNIGEKPTVILLVVVVDDSHIQRIVLPTEETTAIQQVSHRPIKC